MPPFTDMPLFVEEFGPPEPPGTTIAVEGGVRLAREYVAVFFAPQLTGVDQPLLNDPAP
ncbi:hypothetical protein [Streptomyces sp. NPDC053560]|uniref:hypothetical protein n=1 Tax=Streptomyces sp. NPDC053560 TaxID=3365711 RepID=UPI0037CFBA36